MSVVYLAEDLRLKRKVALKHPNIVPIYEAGTTDELLFIAISVVTC